MTSPFTAAAALLGVGTAGLLSGLWINTGKELRRRLQVDYGLNPRSVALLSRAVPLLRRLHDHGNLGFPIPDGDTRLVAAWLADYDHARDHASRQGRRR